MSDKKKTVVVFGATGQQGSWAAKAFHDAGWRVIGVSRSSRLAKHCDEMRAAELESAEQVAKACQGADVVFGVTQPWDKSGKVHEEREKRQAEVRGCCATAMRGVDLWDRVLRAVRRRPRCRISSTRASLARGGGRQTRPWAQCRTFGKSLW